MHQPDTKPLLQTRDLSVAFGDRTVLHGVSLTLRPDEVLGIVGETGAGKSVLARALIGLLPGKGRISGGTVSRVGGGMSSSPMPFTTTGRYGCTTNSEACLRRTKSRTPLICVPGTSAGLPCMGTDTQPAT